MKKATTAPKKTAAKLQPTIHIEQCIFDGALRPEQVAALTALANALVEQAKAAQFVAAALKGPDALLKIGGDV